MSNLVGRLTRLEALRLTEPLVIRMRVHGSPPLTAEEEAVLEAEVQRRLRAGESLVVISWSAEEARRLGAPERIAQPQAKAVTSTIAGQGVPTIS